MRGGGRSQLLALPSSLILLSGSAASWVGEFHRTVTNRALLLAIPFWNSPPIAALGSPCLHITLAGDVTLLDCIHYCIPLFHSCYQTCASEAERGRSQVV